MDCLHVRSQGRQLICHASTLARKSINERKERALLTVRTVGPGILFCRPALKEKAARTLEEEVSLDSCKTLELSGEIVG